METLLASPDPNALTRRLSELIAAKRFGAARPMLAALRRMDQSASPQLAELAAVLELQDGHLEAARHELDAALLRFPQHSGLHRRRAELRHRVGDLAGAALDAADAVLLDPTDANGKALLGLLMTDLGRPADGVRCLREAVAAAPADVTFLRGLANAQAVSNDLDQAATTLANGIAAAPASPELRNAAVLLAVQRQLFDDALLLADAARQDGVADACLFGLQGHALSKLGRGVEAAEAYAEALRLAPDDPYVRHLVASCSGAAEPDCAAPEYVRAVFDDYADRFDAHLISLGYRIPGAIRAVMPRYTALHQNTRFGPVLDLGCGTGMVAVALSDLPVGPFIGVDISSRMLSKAKATQFYAALHEAEITRFLAADQAAYPLIIAADVLCYFGAITQLMTAVARRLEVGGLFIVSFEELAPADAPRGWALGQRGRYAHTVGHVTAVAEAAGLTVLAMDNQVVRNESAMPVPGRLAVLQRPAHAA
ncbi:MAG TPA: tetratricopeptide repeat protein [Acetobacteraceae bacterium]|nr:tetratricopeptide repeat protein [Acetobacteraceae bacterium]